MKKQDNNLKTLKDIDKNLLMNNDCIYGVICDLKKEAIKWIKELKKHNGTYEDGGLGRFMETGPEFVDANLCSGLINWIKHFFNINDD